MRIVKAGLLYFAVVFGAGFVLGTIRTLWVVPRVGSRAAELIEAPVMLLVTIVAARWVVTRLAVPSKATNRMGMGGIGFVLLLVAEYSLLLPVRGLSLREYLANRDPVAESVYYALLVVFAIMPLFVERTIS